MVSPPLSWCYLCSCIFHGRVDLKAIMAEAENSKIAGSGMRATSAGKTRVVGFDVGDNTGKRVAGKQSQLNAELPRSGSGSPWRLPASQADAALLSDPNTAASGGSEARSSTCPDATVSGLTQMVKDSMRMTPLPSHGLPSSGIAASQSKPSFGPTFSPARHATAARGPPTPRRVSYVLGNFVPSIISAVEC